MYLGGFPSEQMIALAMKNKQTRNLPIMFWFWIAFMFVGAVVSIVLQLIDRHKNIEKYKYQQKFEIIRYLDFKSLRNHHLTQKYEDKL
jgi:hypothetical protein